MRLGLNVGSTLAVIPMTFDPDARIAQLRAVAQLAG